MAGYSDSGLSNVELDIPLFRTESGVGGALRHDLLGHQLHLLLESSLLLLQSLDHLQEGLLVVSELGLLVLHLLQLLAGPLSLRRGLHQVRGSPIFHCATQIINKYAYSKSSSSY